MPHALYTQQISIINSLRNNNRFSLVSFLAVFNLFFHLFAILFLRIFMRTPLFFKSINYVYTLCISRSFDCCYCYNVYSAAGLFSFVYSILIRFICSSFNSAFVIATVAASSSSLFS